MSLYLQVQQMNPSVAFRIYDWLAISSEQQKRMMFTPYKLHISFYQGLCNERVIAICNEIKKQKRINIARLDFFHCNVTPRGAKHVGAMIAAVKGSSLTHLRLSWNNLGAKGVKLLAKALCVNNSLREIDLSNTFLCDLDEYGGGAYNFEGIFALSDALRTNGALTRIDLSGNCARGGPGAEFGKALASGIAASSSMKECVLKGNNLGEEGWTSVFDALRDSPSSKITKWDLCFEGLGCSIAKPLAEYVSVASSLTICDMAYNHLDELSMEILRTNANDHRSLNFEPQWSPLP